ncbi:dTDP-4-dehydrorhamnose 3,5-epimerase family protein [Pararhizobium gei]|uniref:dTDP-4-dehydrorhamnose 3,5-epimerase family protein n=1 Tax=Pararhizobium gei TaxID=1395951 RepID=UPI0023DB1DAB|nr:dTDP-4-dehydrorhamnose 3,5-epimerase family protein [Rhizobium gei]
MSIKEKLSLIEGAHIFRSNVETDHRGSLSAFVFADESNVISQFNIVRSKGLVLRGVHAHSLYDEYYIALTGTIHFALMDARKTSPTFGAKVEFTSFARDMIGFRVPAGVAHGALFLEDGELGYGLSHVWDGAGEFECRWDDPEMGFDWPIKDPILSERDAASGTYSALVEMLNQRM